MQRTADLAAMAGVQVISGPSGCAGVTTNVQQNATANGFAAGGNNTITTTCGRWDTSAATHFGTSGTPLNAVQVKVTQSVPYFFLGPARSVNATATAVATNVDAFSLGTGIATINTQQSALLNAILGGLLNSKVSLSLADTQSLASAHVKLEDLMVALGASSMKGLLNTTVSYQQLMGAMVTALQTGGDSVNAALLQTLAVTVPGGQNITVGDNGQSAPGLLALGLANPDSAATATINVLDAAIVAAQISQSRKDPTKAPVINVTAGLPGIAGISLQMIYPPALAVGEGGLSADGITYRTQARTAAVNATVTLVPAVLPTLSVGGGSLLAVTISAASTPIVLTLQAGQGAATLNSVDCENTRAATTATIKVAPGVAYACLASDAGCSKSVTLGSLSAVILGAKMPVGYVGLNPTGQLPLSPGATTPLVFDGSSGSFDVTKSANSNAVGSDAATLTNALLAALPNMLQVVPAGGNLSLPIGPIVEGLTGLLTPILQPVFNLLDTVFVPTLALLGIQIGTATVHNMSLTCGVSQLVN
jgi:uncharacterized membrane protein